MSLSAPQTARPSPSYGIAGESESTSDVKFVVLEIEIDYYVRVRIGNESWVIAAFLNKESDWYFYQSPSSGLLTIYYFRLRYCKRGPVFLRTMTRAGYTHIIVI
jgi:hypothetical protein